MTDEQQKPIDPLALTEEEFSGSDQTFLDLFQEGDITLRTQLNEKEVMLANCIFIDNEMLKKCFQTVGKNVDVFGDFLNQYKRHKVSLNRASRTEFVDINRKDRFNQHLQSFANLKNLVEPRT